MSGVGGVLRDSEGTFIGRFSKATGLLWAYEAEVKAILSALQFCKEHDVTNVLIESDSTLAVGWVSNKQNRPWKLLNELHMIDMLMVDVGCVGVVHIFREANDVADL